MMKKMLAFVWVCAVAFVGVAYAAERTEIGPNEKIPESWMKTGFSCSPVGCQKHDASQSFENSPEMIAARERAEEHNLHRYEITLRRMGMMPETARKAIWALVHKPQSACTMYVRQLTADYDMGSARFTRGDDGGYDADLIISIETSGVCEKKNLK